MFVCIIDHFYYIRNIVICKMKLFYGNLIVVFVIVTQDDDDVGVGAASFSRDLHYTNQCSRQ